jgi:hypothetical protein
MGGCGPRALGPLGDYFDEFRLIDKHLSPDANNGFIKTVAGNLLAFAVEPVARVENKVSYRGLGPAGIALGELPHREQPPERWE